MIKKNLENILRDTFGREVKVERPEHSQYGDYSTNIAMILAKEQEEKVRQVAEDIAQRLQSVDKLKKYFAKIEVAGPGFINFWLSKDIMTSEVRDILIKKQSYGRLEVGKGKKVLVEYSSPNIAKSFSIGHLRSTIIGQALFNLYEFLNFEVIADNHLGDWGTQFGAVLYKVGQSGKKPQELTLKELEQMYISFSLEAKDNPELQEKARGWFKKLEEGDSEARRIWQAAIDTSKDEFSRIYSLLGVNIEYAFGESFYEDKMPVVIEEVREKKLSRKSEGAEIVEFDKMPPAMLVKSDGTTTYFTRDLATLKFRLDRWHPDKIIYEVGSEQILHFRQLFKTVEMLGWTDNVELIHVAHGLVGLKGRKMSTREGTSIKLEDVLIESMKRGKDILEKSETGKTMDVEEKEEIAKAVGVGAIKYFDLMHQPATDIIFDWEKVFVLEGNSAPYLQYTVTRIESVTKDFENIDISMENLKFDEAEHNILRELPKFSEVLEEAAFRYSPNLLCNYLYSLAKKYNYFYNKLRIRGEEKADFRLALSTATGQILKNGLGILGIEVLERM